MNLNVTRRQFGQLVAIGTAATATGLFSNKILAQQSSTLIFGVRHGKISNTDSLADPNSDTTDLTDARTTADILPSALETIVVESFDVASQNIQTVLRSAPILEIGEQISGFVSLKDGTFVVAATNTDSDKKKDERVRLIFLSKSPKSVAVSGLKNKEALRSLLRLKDGSVVGLVDSINGASPSRIVTINPDTGDITDRNRIPDQKRVNALAQCPDGTFYGIAVEKTGETSLFEIDQEQSTKLSFNGQQWNSGLIGLVCAASNQFYALGALRHQEYPLYLHTVNANTGEIKRINKGFNVSAITIR